MALGEKRNPRVKMSQKVKIAFAAIAAIASSPKFTQAGITTLHLYRDGLQKAVNAAALAEKPPRQPMKDNPDGSGGKVLAFPVDDATAKLSLSTVFEKWANDKRHIPTAKTADKFGNVKIYVQGSGEHTSYYYLDTNEKGESVKVPLPETVEAAKLPPQISDPAISGFAPGERTKQDLDAMFAEASEMEIDTDALLAQYGLTETK